jgi:hypothetical protein
MGKRSGSADLPLHGGRVPQWLASRMARLGRVVTEALILHYGRDELLRRLGDPFWFQALGCVMGMDWHSSGITTSVMGALKRGLGPVQHELGLYICGGRGRHSRKTPRELLDVGERVGLDGEALGRTSRLVAKVDSAAVQDGFELYLHSFVVAEDGQWAVVQQGMNTDRRQARRYHWISAGLRSFVEAPHAGIDGPNQGRIINLTDRRARDARRGQVSLVNGRGGPDEVVERLHGLRHLQLPAHHDVRYTDVMLRRLHGALTVAADAAPGRFEDLLLTRGIGARTVQALALVSEVVHGAPCRFDDPARFAFAHGGKDGHPHPVPLRVYDQTLSVLRRAVEQARLGRTEKLEALQRLEQQVRLVERAARGPSLGQIIQHEREASHLYGGRTVSGPARPPAAPARAPTAPRRGQLTLPGLGDRRES